MMKSSEIWKVELSTSVVRLLKKDKSALGQIKKAISKLSSHSNPEDLGKCLKGNFSGLYSYRTGSYRIIYQLNKEIVTILIVRVGHRKDVYKGR